MASSTVHEVNRYVLRNIFAMLGSSAYVLIDTLFISIAAGALGLTTLNLGLPVFNMMNSLGLLLGVGGSALFSLNKIDHPEKVRNLYGELAVFGVLVGLIFAVAVNLFIHPFVNFLGANAATRSLAIPYIRIISCGAPLVILNYMTINFVRNDANPSLVMKAALIGTVAVIFADWLLIFVCHLNMVGAAIAYSVEPVVSLIVLTNHRKFVKRRLEIHFHHLEGHFLRETCALGLSAALNELGAGVSVYFFNQALLHLAGNYAVAAYGIISNLAIVFNAMANGVALGVQPVASREIGVHHVTKAKQSYNQGLLICLGIAIIGYIIMIIFKNPLISAFNSQHQVMVAKYASVGLPIYFSCLPMLNINILTTLFLAGTNTPRSSFTISLLRGYLLLIPMILFMAKFFGVNGVFAAVPVTELCVLVISFILLRIRFKNLGLET